jgi:hypothetical protein
LSEPRRILVLANETAAGKSLVDKLKERAEQGPIEVTVIAPQNAPRAGFIVYDESRRSCAERRLRRALTMLEGAEIPAEGEVVDPDPLQSLRDALYQYRPDEVIISTHPELKSRWLRGNLIDQARKAAGDTPVEHIVVDLSAPRERTHVLVVANQTLLGEPLLQALRERAEEGPAEFTLVAPADVPGVRERLEEAVRRLRDAGLDASGHIGHPDPYIAVMNAIDEEGVDELVISTLPRATSGWMRRNVLERVRGATDLPVRHVVVEPAETEAAPAA